MCVLKRIRFIARRCKQWQPNKVDLRKTMKGASLFFLLVVCAVIPSYGQRPWQTKITSDHIRIEHWGPSDAPIRELIITTTKLKKKLDLMETEVLVDKNLFSVVNDFLNTEGLIGNRREINEFGVFKVTRLVHGEGQLFYFPTRRKSVSIWKSLREKINDRPTSETLILEIDKILKRIDS
jgi:hypothetical protein